MSKQTQIPENILLCPFCNGLACLHNMTEDYSFFIGCDHEECEVNPGLYRKTIAAAIISWNTRGE